MVPARNLLRRHYDCYGGGHCCDDVDDSTPHHHYTKQSPLLIRSNLMMMAEHHHTSTTTTTNTGGGGGGGGQAQQQQQETTKEQESEQDQEVGTSTSKPEPPPAAADDRWLQLGIGVSPSSSAASFTTTAAAPVPVPVPSGPPSVELQLFSDKPSSPSSPSTLPLLRPPALPMFSPPSPQLGYRPTPWGFWNTDAAGCSDTSPQQSPMMMMLPPQLYNVPPFPLLPQRPESVEGGPHLSGGDHVRVVSPPVRRQQAIGVWFLLKAADNQVREPFLPQIPKSYIRIKDGRMTVRLLMKYLVKKLGLDHESEVQISCRGHLLPPLLTLQHVRDQIWCSSEAVAFLPDSPSIDHVMTLQYGRSP